MKKNIIVIHTSPLWQKYKSVVNRLPPKQKTIKNLFFVPERSAIAPSVGAIMNTKRPVVPARNPHKVAALVAISIPENLKIQPSDGTITVAKYIGKRAAITVVANAELAQSYIHHANTFLSFSFFINSLDD
jgi:hypothetical protein